MVRKVVMKLTPDRVDEAPNITIPAINNVVPGLADISPPPDDVEYGGYMTQVISPVCPLKMPANNKIAAPGSIQKARALTRGKARS